jgi:hypothetical protein
MAHGETFGAVLYHAGCTSLPTGLSGVSASFCCSFLSHLQSSAMKQCFVTHL